MGKKRTPATAEDGCVLLQDQGLSLRLYRTAGKVTVELTERREHGQPIRQTVNFACRQKFDLWLDAERIALERPMLYQALCRAIDEFLTPEEKGGPQ